MTAKPQAPAWLNPAAIVDLLKLAVPVALSRAAVMLMSFTDAVVLGRNAELELPFITNGYLLVGMGMAIGMGVLQGVQVFTAELSGNGYQRDTGRILRRGLGVGLILGMIFTLIGYFSAGALFRALGFEPEIAEGTASATRILSLGLIGHMLAIGGSLYLEALRKPILVTVLMYIGVVINLVIDLALVAGWWGFPKLGADGVAWATTGTRFALTFAFFVVIWMLTPGFKRSSPAPKDEFWRQNTVGVGGAVANVAEFGGFNFSFVIATWVSIAAGTVYSLAIQPIFLTFMLFMGIGTATSVRVAEAYGRKDGDGVREAARLGVTACIAAGLVMSTLMWVFKDPLARLMLAEDATFNGQALLPALTAIIGLAAFVALFDGLQGVASMALRAQEIVWPSAIIQIGSYFILMLPLAYWLAIPMGGGAMGVMQGVAVTSVIAALAQTAWLELKAARRPSLRAAPKTIG
ncbi:MAG: MATE family efflux transporter [Pseudomonadota bacterium]